MPAWVGQRGIKHTIGILFLGTICCSFVFHESLAFSSLEIDFSGSRDIFLEGKTQKRQPEWTWDRILGRHFLYMSDESPISLPPPWKRLLIIWLPWRNLEFAVALVLYLACIIFFFGARWCRSFLRLIFAPASGTSLISMMPFHFRAPALRRHGLSNQLRSVDGCLDLVSLVMYGKYSILEISKRTLLAMGESLPYMASYIVENTILPPSCLLLLVGDCRLRMRTQES